MSRKERKKEIEHLKVILNTKRLMKIETTVSRINIINKEKQNVKKIFKKLMELHAELSVLIKKTKKRISAIENLVLKMKREKYKALILIIKEDINKIKILEDSFFTLSKKVTQKEEFLRNEMSYYKKNLREVIKVYREKRILLNRIASNIDSLNNKIKNNDYEFEKALNRGETKNAYIILKTYSRNVMLFLSIIDKGPSLQTYLYTIIPNIIQELVEQFKTKKSESGSSISHLNFKKTIQDIAVIFREAKDEFMNLNINQVGKLIKKILKSIKITEKNINYEIQSRNYFIKNYLQALKETRIVLKDYVDLKKNIRGLISKGFQVSDDLSELTYKIEEREKTLDGYAVKFRSLIKNVDVPFSSKIARLKILLQKVNELKIMINAAIETIWTLNMNHLIVKNKFRKAESALNEIIANTKKYKIRIIGDEEESFEEILKTIVNLASYISNDNINEWVSNKVDQLVKKVASYYEAVGGKIQMIEIIQNMIKELSKERAINEKLNYELIRSERQYLDGQYTGSLNTIVLFLETRGK